MLTRLSLSFSIKGGKNSFPSMGPAFMPLHVELRQGEEAEGAAGPGGYRTCVEVNVALEQHQARVEELEFCCSDSGTLGALQQQSPAGG